MHRSQRLALLAQLLGERRFSSQEELAQALARAGIAVTQATLSRDLRSLGVAKRPGRRRHGRSTSCRGRPTETLDRERQLLDLQGVRQRGRASRRTWRSCARRPATPTAWRARSTCRLRRPRGLGRGRRHDARGDAGRGAARRALQAPARQAWPARAGVAQVTRPPSIRVLPQPPSRRGVATRPPTPRNAARDRGARRQRLLRPGVRAPGARAPGPRARRRSSRASTRDGRRPSCCRASIRARRRCPTVVDPEALRRAARGRRRSTRWSRCLPHGAWRALAARAPGAGAAAARVIDLSSDYPRRRASGYVYGLPEAFRAAIAGATRIANPGCYPTAATLALLPAPKPAGSRGRSW